MVKPIVRLVSVRHITLLGSVGTAYGGAVLALAVAEILAVRSVDSAEFGSYQFVRTLVPLIVLVGLAGLDQAIPRHFANSPDEVAWKRLVLTLVPGPLLLSLPVAAGSRYVFDLPWPYVLAVVLLASPVAVTETLAAVNRARRKYTGAALVQQAYRLLLALAIVALLLWDASIPVLAFALLAAAAGAVLVARFTLRHLPSGTRVMGRSDYRYLRSVGLPIAASTITLGALDWVDVAALTWRFDSFAIAGVYASAKLLTTLPMVVCASVLGFVAMPELARRSGAIDRGFVNRVNLLAALASLAMALGVGGLFLVGAVSLIPRPPSGVTFLLLLGAGMCRLAYVGPSSILGAVGSPRAIRGFAWACLGALAVEAAVIAWLPVTDPQACGAAGLLVASAIRWAAAWKASLAVATGSRKP